MSGSGLRAQEVAVEARLDTTDILIGDQIKLNIGFTMPLDYRVIWPFYQDTLTRNIEIIGQSAVDTLIHEGENLVNMFQTITITAFDSGYYYIPPLKFHYQPIDDTGFTEVASMPMYLRVHTMEVDTAQAIKAIKPPLGAPLSFKEILPWLLIGFAAAVVIFLIIYIIRKHRKKEPIFKIWTKPLLPPHVIAINELEELKLRKLWQAGKTKDFYTKLTDIIRVYVEGRFGVKAAEMTTDEIMEGIKNTDITRESIDKLGKTLVLADLVKFAKEKPLPLDNDNSMRHSLDFVYETRPQSVEPEVIENIPDADNTEEETEK